MNENYRVITLTSTITTHCVKAISNNAIFLLEKTAKNTFSNKINSNKVIFYHFIPCYLWIFFPINVCVSLHIQ